MAYSTIDLHCHTQASDGELSPGDVVKRAADNGVKMLAITDHDSIAGLGDAGRQAKRSDIRLISGIEFSAQWRGHGIHILGYHFDCDHSAIVAATKRQQEARIGRAQEISERLVKQGLPELLEPAKSLAHSGVPGRPHFARAMIEAGVVKDMNEAFNRYLGAGKVGDVKNCWPEVSEVVEWINDAGGVAVIAHPRKYKLTLTKLRELITLFKSAGGVGIEVVVSGQKQGEVGLLADLCRRYVLHGSVGSDFHSPKYPWAELGRVPQLPDSVTPVWMGW